MKLWMREVRLMAGGKSFDGDKFDIDFNIPFSTSKDPDVAEIKIYNLSPQTVSAIRAEAYVILNAGYRGDIGNIFSGSIENVDIKWDKVDKIITIRSSDGGFQWRFSSVQETYAPGSTATDILGDLIPRMGYEIGELNVKDEITYQLGRTISGDIEKALKIMVKDTNSKMYVDKGRMFIRPEPKGTQIGFLLRADTGLIDSPERVEEENEHRDLVVKYNVKCLLNHKITTDSIIQVESRTANGNFRVESGTHKGEHKGDFLTELVVVPA